MTRIAKAILGAVLLLAAPLALAQGANWTISEVAGSVTVKAAATALPVSRGASVPAGAVLVTGSGSRAVLVRGKDFMTVNANSRVRIPAAADKASGFFDILQELGNAVFQIEKKPDPHFGVRTPYLAAVVKGTTFSITVSDQGASLQVLEGAVETSTVDGDARELIRPGVIAMVEASDRMRLTVQDQQTRTIDSPAKADGAARGDTAQAAGTPTDETPEPVVESVTSPSVAEEQMNDGVISSDAAGNSDNDGQFLTEAITAKPVNLSTTTDGFVGGAVVAQIASNDVSALRHDAVENDSVSGNSGSSGGGSASSNAGGNSSDNGTASSNSGGSDNGNSWSSGPDNSNSGSNGGGSDDDTGNNASGNGNSGSIGGGSDDDSGSNASGNGNSGSNGNGSDDDTGNNASGNGNSGSNGNGSDDDSGNNGSGNGNSGSNGNGSDDDTGNSGSGNGNSGSNGNGSDDDSGNNGSGNGNSGSNGGGSDDDTGNNGSGNGNSGSNGNGSDDDTGNSGSGNGNSGSNGDGSDDDTGNSGSGNGNSGSNGGGSDDDSGNNGSGNGNSGSNGNGSDDDTGNSGSGNGNSGSNGNGSDDDTGNSGSGNGNSGSNGGGSDNDSGTSALSDADGLGAFSFQWLRNGVAVAGATASSYTLGDLDVGSVMRVQVSWVDGQGTTESVDSAATAPVASVNDAPIGVPAITGTATEDQMLTADTSALSDADGLGAFNYQWLRNGVAVAGATASTYTLGDVDVGSVMRVQVSWTDGQGSTESLTSAATAAVGSVNDAPTGVPAITGTATEDQMLTADTSAIADADGLGAFSYQWLRNGVAVAGATASTYTLGDLDVGSVMRAQVSWTDGQGSNETLTSAATAPVANVNDAPTGAPALVGSVVEDLTLSVDTSAIADADGLGAFSYQWLRNGVAVAGATASSYTLGDLDVGSAMRVQVSWTDGQGSTESLTSPASAAVASVNDAPSACPRSLAHPPRTRRSRPTPAPSATPTAWVPSATNGCATAWLSRAPRRRATRWATPMSAPASA